MIRGRFTPLDAAGFSAFRVLLYPRAHAAQETRFQ